MHGPCSCPLLPDIRGGIQEDVRILLLLAAQPAPERIEPEEPGLLDSRRAQVLVPQSARPLRQRMCERYFLLGSTGALRSDRWRTSGWVLSIFDETIRWGRVVCPVGSHASDAPQRCGLVPQPVPAGTRHRPGQSRAVAGGPPGLRTASTSPGVDEPIARHVERTLRFVRVRDGEARSMKPGCNASARARGQSETSGSPAGLGVNSRIVFDRR